MWAYFMLISLHVLYFSKSVTCNLQIGHKWSQIVSTGHKLVTKILVEQ